MCVQCAPKNHKKKRHKIYWNFQVIVCASLLLQRNVPCPMMDILLNDSLANFLSRFHPAPCSAASQNKRQNHDIKQIDTLFKRIFYALYMIWMEAGSILGMYMADQESIAKYNCNNSAKGSWHLYSWLDGGLGDHIETGHATCQRLFTIVLIPEPIIECRPADLIIITLKEIQLRLYYFLDHLLIYHVSERY